MLHRTSSDRFHLRGRVYHRGRPSSRSGQALYIEGRGVFWGEMGKWDWGMGNQELGGGEPSSLRQAQDRLCLSPRGEEGSPAAPLPPGRAPFSIFPLGGKRGGPAGEDGKALSPSGGRGEPRGTPPAGESPLLNLPPRGEEGGAPAGEDGKALPPRGEEGAPAGEDGKAVAGRVWRRACARGRVSPVRGLSGDAAGGG